MAAAANVATAAAGMGTGTGATVSTGTAGLGTSGPGQGAVSSGMASALIFCTQRFVVISTGFSANTSGAYRDIGRSFAWMTGQIAFIPPTSDAQLPPEGGRRLLGNGGATTVNSNATDALPQVVAPVLLNRWLSLLLAISICIALHIVCTWWWRHMMNSSFYAKITPRFVPFPSSLVWPNVPVFVISCFGTGMAFDATNAIAGGTVSTCVSGGVTLAFLLIFVAFIVWELLYAATLPWKQLPRAKTPAAIEDPIMFAVAQWRSVWLSGLQHLRKCSRSSRVVPAAVQTRYEPSSTLTQTQQMAPTMSIASDEAQHTAAKIAFQKATSTMRVQHSPSYADRSAGHFELPLEDGREPSRTERLLAAPFALRRARAGDAQQQVTGFILAKVNGADSFGTFFRVYLLLVNVTIGALAGVGRSLPARSATAAVLTGIVFGIQLLTAAIIFCLGPCSDRVHNFYLGFMYLLEGLSLGCLLLIMHHPQPVHELEGSALALALGALCVPLVAQIEGAILTPTLRAARRGGCQLRMLPVFLAERFRRLGEQLRMILQTMVGGDYTASDASDASASTAILNAADEWLDSPIRGCLADGTILLLRTEWLVSEGSNAYLARTPDGTPILRRRQDLPEVAFLTPAEAAALFDSGQRKVLVLS